MEYIIKYSIKYLLPCLMSFLFISCSGYSILPKHRVQAVPDAKYERIIKLNNPDGFPENTLAGVIHVTGKAAVCTDFPRVEIIKSLDDLDTLEKLSYPYFRNYALKEGEELLGYVSVSIGYEATIWRIEKDPACKYKVQIIEPIRSMGPVERSGGNKSILNW